MYAYIIKLIRFKIKQRIEVKAWRMKQWSVKQDDWVDN